MAHAIKCALSRSGRPDRVTGGCEVPGESVGGRVGASFEEATEKAARSRESLIKNTGG